MTPPSPPPGPAPSGPIIKRLAEVSHRFWCEEMKRDGWTKGASFDPSLKTHDAIRSFGMLKPPDRRCACRQMAYSGVAATLAGLIQYDRTANPPLEVEEMRAGLPVHMTSDNDLLRPWQAGGENGRREVGRIESWDTDSTGEFLLLVRVRWPDGSLTEHAPLEKDLERLPRVS